MVTTLASSRFSIGGDWRAFSTRLFSSKSVVERHARIAPLSRIWRTSARVSMPSIATMFQRFKYASRLSSARQFDVMRLASRTTKPSTHGREIPRRLR